MSTFVVLWIFDLATRGEAQLPLEVQPIRQVALAAIGSATAEALGHLSVHQFRHLRGAGSWNGPGVVKKDTSMPFSLL